ncbi:hypothetical protein PsorP6_009404 [Peronosclerospora sorghi]|uniref:Uncharacterized protein n=1 Tax=Peronosclerospora sorghi TaxID=230839 RepID=A0ACC0VXV4_9STRA|nr:hypothetical protein PsorP6_009404 [Peronosclerospora sorghi]
MMIDNRELGFYGDLGLCDVDWEVIRFLDLHVLKHFMATDKFLEGFKYVTISMVPSAFRMLRQDLRKAVAALKDGVKSEGADNMKKGCRAVNRGGSSFKAATELLLDTMERMILDLENRWGAGVNQLDELPLAMVFAEALDPRTVDFAYMAFNGTVDGKKIWELIADAVFEAAHNLSDATSLEKKRKRPNDEDEVAGGRRADNKARKAGAWGDLLSRRGRPRRPSPIIMKERRKAKPLPMFPRTVVPTSAVHLQTF